MYRPNLFAASVFLMLSGCGDDAPTPDSPAAIATPAVATAVPGVSEPMPSDVPTPPVSSTTQAPSSPAPPPLPVPPVAPQAQKGPEGARAVLRTWAQALESRQFDVAWEQFGHPPASRAAFIKWWERYGTIKVALGPGEGDAAMGSLYYTAPATLTGTTVAGKPFRLQGDVVVRRVNDVDGATPAQLRWHIGTADLKEIGGG